MSKIGCLKDFELEGNLKLDTKLIYCKPLTVLLALLNDLKQAYEAGIKRDMDTNQIENAIPIYQSAKYLKNNKRRPIFVSVGNARSL